MSDGDPKEQLARLWHGCTRRTVRQDGVVTVPGFQTVMVPVLRHLLDGQGHPSEEIIGALALALEQIEPRLQRGTQ